MFAWSAATAAACLFVVTMWTLFTLGSSLYGAEITDREFVGSGGGSESGSSDPDVSAC